MKRLAMFGAVVGLFLIVMIAASVQGIPDINPPVLEPREIPPVEASTEPMPTGIPTPLPESNSDVIGAIIGVIFFVLASAAALAIIVLVVRALMRAWRDRPMRIRDGSDVGIDLQEQALPDEPDVAAPVIRRGIQGALRLIDERAVPTDAIIAAWVGLEESAADAGTARGMSETPSEFALRIITRREGISDAARELLRLYENVRFGDLAADEGDRDRARAALRIIEEGWR
ncbi:DUF4129 domain-containing protein [Microbacterium sp. A93]|uniref:DUF4129 domain-containing protein n=1 Tax=Microbacterium sp. A93 TaxID=3450716 RepID=UPI003F425784